jgi:chemotaxis protein methyltransferase CheR
VKELTIPDIELRALIEAIYLKYNYDFRSYSFASVRRRATAVQTHFGFKTISAMQEQILRNGDLFDSVLQYLTVSTTEMFRDPTYFKSVRENVLPHLKTYPSFKIWIAGCSTGEEVYSLAILLNEENLLDRCLIYATDINPSNLRAAEKGIYSAEQIQKYAVNYANSGGRRNFSEYYTTAYQSAEMAPWLRKNVVFADHSLATDSVFCEVEMVSCRNVIIYFERDLQNRTLGLFHDSLSRQGFLGLGSKESLRFSAYHDHFEVFDEQQKIYRKRR